MHTSKIVLGIWLLVIALIIGGCSLFPTNKTRPAPVRPRMTSPKKATPTPKLSGFTRRVKPAPTKRLKGLSSLTAKRLVDRIDKISQAASRRNWSMATRETNTLGLEMGRFRSMTSKGKSLREIASFNAIYTKLQTDVRIKNKNAVIQDTRRLKTALSRLKRTA